MSRAIEEDIGMGHAPSGHRVRRRLTCWLRVSMFEQGMVWQMVDLSMRWILVAPMLISSAYPIQRTVTPATSVQQGRTPRHARGLA